MPPNKPAKPLRQRPIQEVVEQGPYPAEAYDFIQQGLSFSVNKIHGQNADPDANRHVSGQQLCHGLREYALAQWGMLARVVLRKWNITSTLDFGRIVFSLIEAKYMQKTDDDTLEDFRGVFDFRTAMESDYRIPTRIPTQAS
jgi:uncharacterized repeat protein (TIGR04138 family)